MGGFKDQINAIKDRLRQMDIKLEKYERRTLQMIVVLKAMLDKYHDTRVTGLQKKYQNITMEDLVGFLDGFVRDTLNDKEPGLGDEPIDLIQQLVKKHGGLHRR